MNVIHIGFGDSACGNLKVLLVKIMNTKRTNYLY